MFSALSVFQVVIFPYLRDRKDIFLTERKHWLKYKNHIFTKTQRSFITLGLSPWKKGSWHQLKLFNEGLYYVIWKVCIKPLTVDGIVSSVTRQWAVRHSLTGSVCFCQPCPRSGFSHGPHWVENSTFLSALRSKWFLERVCKSESLSKLLFFLWEYFGCIASGSLGHLNVLRTQGVECC